MRTQENVITVNARDIMQNFVINLRTFMKWTMIPQTLLKLKVRKTCLLNTDNVDNENLSDSISAAEEEESSNTIDFVADTISLEENSSSSQPEEVYSLNTLTNKWTVLLGTNESDIQYKIDTGAQCNVLPKVVYNQLLDRAQLKKTSVKLSAYNGTEIPVSGKCLAKIKHKNTVTHVLFIVADTKSSPALGLKTNSNLDLIKRVMKIDSHAQDYFKSYGDCFGELGTLPGVHHIVTDPNVPPVANTPRRIPIAMMDPLKRELQRMENLDVIQHVTEPSDWVNSLVAVEKPNGQLRICLDPRHLNRAIERQHLQLPTAKEIIATMPGAKFFTKFDASSGYWQIKVDQESSKLLTFATPFGRYHFKLLPYGIHSASEIFQASVANVISDIEGSSNSQDDTIIWGKMREELHERTVHVLEAIRKNGTKLNAAKCVFARTELIFLGHN